METTPVLRATAAPMCDEAPSTSCAEEESGQLLRGAQSPTKARALWKVALLAAATGLVAVAMSKWSKGVSGDEATGLQEFAVAPVVHPDCIDIDPPGTHDVMRNTCADYTAEPYFCLSDDDDTDFSQSMCCACKDGGYTQCFNYDPPGSTDSADDDCSDYEIYPYFCRTDDDDTDFSQNIMCCACGGGSTMGTTTAEETTTTMEAETTTTEEATTSNVDRRRRQVETTTA